MIDPNSSLIYKKKKQTNIFVLCFFLFSFYFLHDDINKFHVNISVLHVAIDKLHANMIMLHIDMTFLSYMRQKYATIDIHGFWLLKLYKKFYRCKISTKYNQKRQ